MFLATKSQWIKNVLVLACSIAGKIRCLDFLWSVKTDEVSCFLLPQHPWALVSQQYAVRIC